MPKYKNVEAQGHKFVFKYEEDYPDLLHIWARHLKAEDDAIYIFFNGTKTKNIEHDCWETSTGNETIWWFWIDETNQQGHHDYFLFRQLYKVKAMTGKERKRIGRGGIEIKDLGDIELPPALDADIQARTKRADDELTATAVNFRWQKEQLELVREVARAMGVPYQTYIKMVVYKQAILDWRAMMGSARQPVEHLTPSWMPSA